MMTQTSKKKPLTPKQAARRASPMDRLLDPAMFKALSDPTRAKIFSCLAKCGRACLVSELAECCSVDLSVVSRHLALLERSGLIESKKEGRNVSYLVKYDAFARQLHALADAMSGCRPNCRDAKEGCCG